jgi:lipopolysaccharide transport system ATP-binding protein
MVGVLIRNRIGMEIYGTNTKIEQVDLGTFEPGEELDIDFRFECWLTPQHYTITVATQYSDGSSHDWLDDVLSFEVLSRRQAAGVADLRARIEWRKTLPSKTAANESATHA